MSENVSAASNPYAAPEAQLAATPGGAAAEGPFYAMTPRKVFIMSFLTLGLYDLVFWYRHWQVRKALGQAIRPAWRAIFGAFFLFALREQITQEGAEREVGMPAGFGAVPFVYIGVQVLGHTAGRLAAQGLPTGFSTAALSLVSAATLSVVQQVANRINGAAGYRGSVNSGFSPWAVLAGLLGCVAWVGLFTPME